MTTQDDNKLFDELADLVECFDVLEHLIDNEVLQSSGLVTFQSISILYRNLNKQLRGFLDKADSKGLLT